MSESGPKTTSSGSSQDGSRIKYYLSEPDNKRPPPIENKRKENLFKIFVFVLVVLFILYGLFWLYAKFQGMIHKSIHVLLTTQQH